MRALPILHRRKAIGKSLSLQRREKNPSGGKERRGEARRREELCAGVLRGGRVFRTVLGGWLGVFPLWPPCLWACALPQGCGRTEMWCKGLSRLVKTAVALRDLPQALAGQGGAGCQPGEAFPPLDGRKVSLLS